MDVACLFSGGKDSVFSAYIASKENKIKFLVTAKAKEGSYMFHHPNIELTKVQAELMGLKQVFYESCSEKEKEVEELEKVLSKLDVEGIVVGAVASEYQKRRIEHIANKLGLKLISPIWKVNEIIYIKTLITAGFKIIITSVSAEGLDKSWLGRIIDENCLNDLIELNKKYGVSIVGEGGEYETFVLDCPLFKNKIEIEASKKVIDNGSGILNITKIKLLKNKKIVKQKRKLSKYLYT